jgi:hypothetical protein
MTPEQRSLRARLAAETRWSKTSDRVAATAPARQAWADRWETQVDPNSVLPPAERKRLAKNAMRAHMLKMSLSASRKRTRNARRVVSGRISGKDVEVEQLRDPVRDDK